MTARAGSEGTVHAGVRVGTDGAEQLGDDAPGDRALLVGGGFGGAPASGHWSLGGYVQGALGGTAGAMVDLRPELRVGPAAWQPGPLLVLGGGLTLGGRAELAAPPWMHGIVGAGWQLPLTESGGLRVVARVHYRERARGELTLGWVWGTPPEPPPLPEPVVEPVAAPEVDLSKLPEDAEIWIPHPWCYWVSRDEAAALLPELPADVRLEIQARTFGAAFATPQTVGGITLVPASSQGSVLVVGAPGDQVAVEGAVLPVEGDGVAQLNVRSGVLPVEVFGGGRRVVAEVAVESGHAVWMRARSPERVSVPFAMGSGVLAPDALPQIQALADNIGGWTYAIEGGFSPEGTLAANLALAETRAAAVQQALLDAGVPAAQILMRPPAVPEGGGAAASKRVAVVIPIPPNGENQ